MNTATAEMPTDELTPLAHEAAAVAAHAERRSSRDMVLEAIMELTDSEMSSKTPDLVRVTGLSFSVVNDSVKVLKQRGQIYSDNGAFFVCSETSLPSRSITRPCRTASSSWRRATRS